MVDEPRTIPIADDGKPLALDAVVTGRGFVTGKPGSGKTNTASVLAEGVLAAGVPLFVVDTAGEYHTLKEGYELLHVGATDDSDMRIRDEDDDVEIEPDHGEELAEMVVRDEVSVVFDTSGYTDVEKGRRLLQHTVEALYELAGEGDGSLVVLVEEAHEFLPAQGGIDDVGEAFETVVEHGPERDVGVCAVSERPASVDTDYLEKCDWQVWHRLTWDNDTALVEGILGEDASEAVRTLATGEGIMRTEWDGRQRTVQISQRETPAPDGAEPAASADAEPVGAPAGEGEPGMAPRTVRTSPDGGTPGAGGPGSPTEDPIWEMAEFVIYVASAVGAAVVAVPRWLRRVVLGRPAPESGTGADGRRPLEGLAVGVVLLLFGLLVGIALGLFVY